MSYSVYHWLSIYTHRIVLKSNIFSVPHLCYPKFVRNKNKVSIISKFRENA